ncbi:hypothetical protein NXY56_005928 [Leishmania guyanensis]|uniref:Transmembrane protein n=2 Tax=Leishmania guyanensis species complex TaxID=38579 RepID=A0AAW3BES6_9TRYP|nr:hypothetical protein, conserved [Leishmania guyanensis]
MSSSTPSTPLSYQGGGGGGIRDIGTVTSGMAIMNFDQKTKPYTRSDLVQFLMNYQANLNEVELRLVEKGMVGTFVGIPVFFGAGYFLSGRLGWHRVVRAMAPLSEEGRPSWLVTHLPKIGRIAFGLSAATIPYIAVQQWFVSRVLELDERESNLSFHVRRLMLSQRSSMMFKRTATREVTREEQQRLLREAEAHVNENRSGQRVSQGLGTGPVDVNLQLGQQVLTPLAQTGYKPMPTQQR